MRSKSDISRREFTRRVGFATAGVLARPALTQKAPDYTLVIGPCTLEASPKHIIRTVGYNGQIPGSLLRLREGRPALLEICNQTKDPEIVHWHGLHSSPDVDGTMEEGSPMIAPGATARLTIKPEPAGFRWYHTHTFAGQDLHKPSTAASTDSCMWSLQRTLEPTIRSTFWPFMTGRATCPAVMTAQ